MGQEQVFTGGQLPPEIGRRVANGQRARDTWCRKWAFFQLFQCVAKGAKQSESSDGAGQSVASGLPSKSWSRFFGGRHIYFWTRLYMGSRFQKSTKVLILRQRQTVEVGLPKSSRKWCVLLFSLLYGRPSSPYFVFLSIWWEFILCIREFIEGKEKKRKREKKNK